MISEFPSADRPYNQVNRGDSIGSFWSTMNIDLQSNLGVMRVSPRMLLNTSSASDAQLGLPIAFTEFNGSWWALCGGSIFRTAASTLDPNEAFTEDSSSGAQTDYDESDDMVVFTNRLFTSNNGGLYAKSSYAGAWSLITSTPSNGILQYFRKFNRLYVGDSSEVESLSSADVWAASGDYTITLPTGFTIVCMTETSDSVWIGTINGENLAGKGSIFRWDGISAQATERYYIEANEICALTTMDDIPYLMDSDGILRQFTGSSFEEVGRLPFGVGRKLPKGTNTGATNPRYIHRRGLIATKNGTIQALVRNIYEDADDTVPENLPSGVWEWSPDFGFTHKYSIGYTPRETTTITDFGQYRVREVGALANANLGDDSSDRNGIILVGANYYTDNTTGTTTNYAIFYDDTIDAIQKKGYFVTTWFDSQEIQDKWERLWSIYKKFATSTDSIVFKFRINEEDPVYADITWVNTTSFTTTTDITAYGPTATGFNGTQGGEVEFIQGTGSGLCAHITNISNNAGTYTVTIDETATGVTTGTGKARFQKWIKLNPSEAQDTVKRYSQMAIGDSSPDIQIKGCLTFTGEGEFLKMALVSNEDIIITS